MKKGNGYYVDTDVNDRAEYIRSLSRNDAVPFVRRYNTQVEVEQIEQELDKRIAKVRK